MVNSKSYIASGILELYAVGITGEKENEEVIKMMLLHEAVRKEIDQINLALEQYICSYDIKPTAMLKNKLMLQLQEDPVFNDH